MHNHEDADGRTSELENLLNDTWERLDSIEQLSHNGSRIQKLAIKQMNKIHDELHSD